MSAPLTLDQKRANLRDWWNARPQADRMRTIGGAVMRCEPRDAMAIDALIAAHGYCVWHAASVHYGSQCRCADCEIRS